jgi:hypothetical protein
MAGVVFASQRGRAKAKRIFREPFFSLETILVWYSYSFNLTP